MIARDGYAAVMRVPIGCLGILMRGDALIGVDFLPASVAARPALGSPGRRVVDQLRRYFEDPAWRFDLPLELGGTPFQRRVWTALRDIPVGEVVTYGGLAARLASSARAIGGACRRNPVPVVVPCHRVVSATGIGGFSGATAGRPLAIKEWLLSHERPA